MRKIFLLFFFVVACSNISEKKTSTEKFIIYDNLSFDEFKSKISNYTENADFPNLKN